MKYTWLLLDADNTIMDFTKASALAFEQVCKDFKLKNGEELYQTYLPINHQLWKAFEKKQVTASDIKVLRMTRFLAAIKNTTIDPIYFDQCYLNQMVHYSEMYEGAEEVLKELKYEYLLSIVTNGLKEVQRPRVRKLALQPYFASIIVSDEIGIAKPDIRYFDVVYQSLKNPPPKSEILIVGDSLGSDIQGGINFGIDTCWVSHGRKNKTKIRPSYKINSILELPALLETIG